LLLLGECYNQRVVSMTTVGLIIRSLLDISDETVQVLPSLEYFEYVLFLYLCTYGLKQMTNYAVARDSLPGTIEEYAR
jgi:hypothetical protein